LLEVRTGHTPIRFCEICVSTIVVQNFDVCCHHKAVGASWTTHPRVFRPSCRGARSGRLAFLSFMISLLSILAAGMQTPLAALALLSVFVSLYKIAPPYSGPVESESQCCLFTELGALAAVMNHSPQIQTCRWNVYSSISTAYQVTPPCSGPAG